MSFRKYNIAIIPSEEISEKAKEVSQEFASSDSYFSLNDFDAHPHISLYHIPLYERDVKKVKEAVERGVHEEKGISLQAESFRQVPGGWLDVSYVRDEGIMRLHRAVLVALEPFWVREFVKNPSKDWTKDQRESANKFGWTEADKRFAPHLTFTRLRSEKGNIPISKNPQEFSFFAKNIGVFELGEHGVCTNLLESFLLQGE